MYAVTFYYTKHQGLLELMFDKEEEAEKVLEQFRDGVEKLCIESKYGKVVLDLQHYGAAVLSDLEKTERLQVDLVVRRNRIERRAKKVFDRQSRTVDQVQSVIQIPSKPTQ